MAGQAVGDLLQTCNQLEEHFFGIEVAGYRSNLVQMCGHILSFSKKQDESLEAPSQTPSPPLRIGASIEAGCRENSEQC